MQSSQTHHLDDAPIKTFPSYIKVNKQMCLADNSYFNLMETDAI